MYAGRRSKNKIKIKKNPSGYYIILYFLFTSSALYITRARRSADFQPPSPPSHRQSSNAAANTRCIEKQFFLEKNRTYIIHKITCNNNHNNII